jgi:2-polyprenyl-3-methyl-5-hydroxy-6-metoxy-1,4-benzoquinol methylase
MNLYERYHSNRKVQLRIISKNDFTYRKIVGILGKYLKPHMSVLDIGCGVGTIDLYLANLGYRVLGIDISINAISIARKNALNLNVNDNVNFKTANFNKLNKKGLFDVVICSEVLEHVVDDKSTVKMIKKYLKKGGIVVASSPSINAPLYRIGVLKKFDDEVGHIRRYSVQNYVDLFRNSEFQIKEVSKTEGVLRNFLFTNSFGGFLLRILNKWPFSEIVTFVDNLLIPIFGESNIYIVAIKK